MMSCAWFVLKYGVHSQLYTTDIYEAEPDFIHNCNKNVLLLTM